MKQRSGLACNCPDSIMAKRDDFNRQAKDTLAKRVGGRCSNPKCRKSTAGPRSEAGKTVNIGVAAHISAASAGGPRFDEAATPAQRRSIENGIWLCQSCAKLIDSDPVRYTAFQLADWKARAEGAALRELEQRTTAGDDELELRATIGITGSLEVIERIGCACLRVSIVCRSKRAARIIAVWMAVRNDQVLPAMEQGFGQTFGHVQPPGAPLPQFVVHLVKLPPADVATVLERDMAANYYLPIQTGGLHLFCEGLAADVVLGATLEGGEFVELLRGHEVQPAVAGLIESWGNEVQCLKVQLIYEVRVASERPPKPGPIGQLNRAPIRLQSNPRP